MSTTNATSINWELTEEDLNRIKDKKEKETGVFHWKTRDGFYKSIKQMDEKELEMAQKVCQDKLNTLNKLFESSSRKTNNLKDQLKSWAYRESKVEEALYDLREGISEEARQGEKEIVD